MDTARIIVIGGGAAGLTAAIMGARAGAPLLLLEKNDRLGKKLLITGKGRCNVTNDTDTDGIIANLPGNGRFLYSALRAFDARQTMRFFEEELGLPLKVERGNRVFPQSDRAADVVDAMVRELKRLKVEVLTGRTVTSIERDAGGAIRGVRTSDGQFHPGAAVIVATGGSTYPGTGSSGDGFRFAGELGHTVTTLRPSLVPLVSADPWVKDLQGLTLKNVRVTLQDKAGKKLGEEFGEMIFTHFGVSGPVILSLSKHATNYWEKSGAPEKHPLHVKINLKPALTPEQLDARIQRDFAQFQRKQFKNALGDLLPKSLIPIVITLSGISEDKFVHQITKAERRNLLETLTALTVTATGHRPMSEAIVTAGGVDIREIDPKTMASKQAPGLFFAGEVVDVDGYTGGFNLQAAWSMGYAAGRAAAKLVKAPPGGL
ncbi:aminoacetone oxidase family FAD-binding enzyme [Heliobacterium undosum]|uniref:Aminoacetone oxidase family FAD-binding enzyme n=1 Tax=Heliomicrobium undosum TaxID=121734 RepID=A0A845KXX0_9FIRM|nr:NAD(P)/FAD-dependent oxidoreductase [Heliomicrobium undosum]MZP28163.1 aminoacetone oxidase family FAD-binding enzyme [Heliomicrobium undosum]